MLFANPPKPRSPYQPTPKTFLSLLAFVALGTFPVQALIQPTSAVTLEWDAVPETDIQGYRLFVGTQSGQYDTFHEAGKLTSFEVTQLQVGQTYYFAVLAVGSTGLESDKSIELAVTLSQPMAAADSYPTFQDTPLNVAAPGVLANDRTGTSATMEAVINTGPSNGSVLLNADGSFAYTPAAGYLGADSFTYHVTDGTLDSNVVTVQVPVKMVTSQLIVNGGFESNFTGWMSTGNQGVQSAAPYTPTEGSQLVAFNAVNRLPDGVLAQSFATVVGQTYTLEFDAGVLAYNSNPQAMQVNVTGISNTLSKEISVTAAPTGIPKSMCAACSAPEFSASRSAVQLASFVMFASIPCFAKKPCACATTIGAQSTSGRMPKLSCATSGAPSAAIPLARLPGASAARSRAARRSAGRSRSSTRPFVAS